MRLFVFVLALLLPSAAWAYPQFQLTTDAKRCNQCHFAPAGGGLINAMGRSEAGDTISSRGNGKFLHGLVDLPAWFQLGGDYRGAALANWNGGTESPEGALFPMQLDLYSRLAAGGFSFQLTVGMRGAARPRDPSLASRIVSREHFLMWRAGEQGAYVRAGRFFAPFGLRLVEHPAYVRRYLGFNTLEETYGVSGGYIKDDWEVHVSAFVPDFVRPVGHQGTGGAVYYERRIEDNLVVGAQARGSVAEEDGRYTAGGIGKYWLSDWKLLAMAELDYVRQQFRVAEGGRNQLASYLGLFYTPLGGYMAGVAWERYDQDLAVKDVARDAFDLQLHWFPLAHIELLLYGRIQVLGGGDGGDPASLIMLQFHYYL